MKNAASISATELFEQAASASKPGPGQKLILKFIGEEHPQLDRAEFHCQGAVKPGYWQQKDPVRDSEHNITWTKVPWAVSLFFLDYVSAGLQGAANRFQFTGKQRGNPAASLGDAICRGEGKLFKLFVEFAGKGVEYPRAQHVFFDGGNMDGKKESERIILPRPDYLPHNAVEIFLDSTRLTKLADIEILAKQIRKAENLPSATKLKPMESQATSAGTEGGPATNQPSGSPKQPAAAPKADKESQPKTDANTEPSKQAEDQQKAEQQSKPKAEPPPIPVAERFPDIDAHRNELLAFLEGGCTTTEITAILQINFGKYVEEQRVATYIEALLHELFPPNKINPKLFRIQDSGRVWENETQIMAIPCEGIIDKWTIKDACQGTLILGAPGSGKTTGSGHAIASHFLTQGFGGLILTTKQGESSDWCKLAGMAGRAGDVAVVCPNGYLRLNMLQYEMERPTLGVKLPENLVNFFKNLVSVVGHRSNAKVNESFWEDNGNAMLQNTVDCFFLANYPITFDALCSFINEAPHNQAATSEEIWKAKPVFGACMSQAEQSAKSGNDVDMYKILCEYWLNEFPNLPPNTRSCITIAFSSMVRALRSRHINDLLSTITTITPESIFNGRIVIIDLPVNEYHEGGLLVQAAWKYLFQRAVLSRADKGWGSRCRPVFLWEDESQNFLIDFDAKFQPVSREYRVACVKLSQNISNFYARFGGGDSARTKVDAIIGSLNTRIFHANGDQSTNDWASKFIGTEIKINISTSTTPSQYNGMNPFGEVIHRLFSKPSVTTGENPVREPAIHPHEFGSFQTGSEQNGFVTEALLAQVGRKFPTGTNYARTFFQQTVPPVTPGDAMIEEARRQTQG
jgi:hypothetical protein